jgi:microcystin-dependent protein
VCEGQAVSRSTYSNLFATIGIFYGSGDGSTTFNLPNLTGNVPVGYDAAVGAFDAIGKTGGATTHTLTTAQIPAHTHNITYAQAGNTATTGSGNRSSIPGTGNSSATTSTGGGGAHNNLQPYIVLRYIIKT